MCGIAGIISLNKDCLNNIRKMTLSQKHRGPDSEGHAFIGSITRIFHSEPNQKLFKASEDDFLALGHRRLSIIDCTDNGIQPMYDESSNLSITYNGEIYNYIELREELIKLGYKFNSQSDTEVILKSYKAWGANCFTKFNGMWSLAIWDGNKKNLVLSRDRFGIKPLHYALIDGSLYFSSEIKAILSLDNMPRELNLSAAIDFLKYGLNDHNNQTFFTNIYSFPPGCFAEINPLDIKFEPTRFWSLQKKNNNNYSSPFKEFKNLLMNSIRLRMRSDVEVGSCLSGGLDSSSIVCIANEINKSQNSEQKLKTFHSAFENPKFDERKWVNIVNEYVSSESHIVYPNAENFRNDLSKLIYAQEAPFGSASIYAQWKVMECANKHSIKVLLDGQGADEILCGYRKYYFFYFKYLIKNFKFLKFLSVFLSFVFNGDRGFWNLKEGKRYLPKFFQSRLSKDFSNYLTKHGKSLWENRQIDLSADENISERQIEDIEKYSLPSLLRYEDRNSMAWSIESRVPFLDYRVVQWSVHAPIRFKLSKGVTKYVLRKSLIELVPFEILDRRDKLGFVTAQEDWIKKVLHNDIQSCFRENGQLINELININLLETELNNLVSGKSSIGHPLIFRVYMLIKWMKVFKVEAIKF